MSNPEKLGIIGEPRLPLRSIIEKGTAKHETTLEFCGVHGHNFEYLSLWELLQFDMIVIKSNVMSNADSA